MSKDLLFLKEETGGGTMRSLVTKMCRVVDECFVRILERECPGVYGKIGVDEMDTLLRRYIDLPREKIPIDWVAFGFAAHPFYEIHLGIPFQISESSTAFQVGFHITDSYLTSEKRSLEPLKVFQYKDMGLEPMTHPSTGEHMFVFPSVSVTYESAGSGIQEAIRRGVPLYRFVHQMLKRRGAF